MGCARSFFDKDGVPHGWVCGSGIVPCSTCGNVADHLCDYPMGKGKTCDAPLCDNHAIKVKRFPQNRLRLVDEDNEWVEFCPNHAALAGIKERV